MGQIWQTLAIVRFAKAAGSFSKNEPAPETSFGGQDMKLKTLLLGSATAFAVVGGAQAADLSVAEPVDYVRVCDAFGVGYWYIPGTDTCIKIGGYVEFTAAFGDLAGQTYEGSHSANWNFVTEAGLNFTAKSMTEYGELVGYVGLVGAYNNNKESSYTVNGSGTGNDAAVRLDGAWLSLGPLLVGHTTSTYDYGGGFSDTAWRSDSSTDQVRLSWAMSGFGIMLGIEDPRDRWGSSLSTSYNMPDLIAAVTASQGTWDGKLSVGFADTGAGSVYGINAGITIGLDGIAPGDKLRLNAAYGTGPSFVGGPVAGLGQATWSAFASFQHFWSPTLSSAITGSYSNNTVTANSAWAAGANLVWAPVSGFSATLQGTYTVNNTANTGVWAGKIALKRSW